MHVLQYSNRQLINIKFKLKTNKMCVVLTASSMSARKPNFFGKLFIEATRTATKVLLKLPAIDH